MSAQVKALQLTEDDMRGLADYFSQQKSPLGTLHR
jgi:cytochrome c553